MKKFAMLALLLSLGVFAIGCNKPAEKKPEAAPAMTEGAAPAAAPAEGAPAEPAK